MSEELIFLLLLGISGLIALSYWRERFLRSIAPLLSIHLARPYRKLTQEEVKVLTYTQGKETKSQDTLKIGKLLDVTLKILLVCMFLGAVIYSLIPSILVSVLSIVIVMGLILAFYKSKKSIEIKLKDDLKSPVFLVQDRVYFPDEKQKEQFDFGIGRYKFHFHLIVSTAVLTAKSLKTNDTVTVLFSPHSMYVWEVEKH